MLLTYVFVLWWDRLALDDNQVFWKAMMRPGLKRLINHYSLEGTQSIVSWNYRSWKGIPNLCISDQNKKKRIYFTRVFMSFCPVLYDVILFVIKMIGGIRIKLMLKVYESSYVILTLTGTDITHNMIEIVSC